MGPTSPLLRRRGRAPYLPGLLATGLSTVPRHRGPRTEPPPRSGRRRRHRQHLPDAHHPDEQAATSDSVSTKTATRRKRRVRRGGDGQTHPHRPRPPRHSSESETERRSGADRRPTPHRPSSNRLRTCPRPWPRCPPRSPRLSSPVRSFRGSGSDRCFMRPTMHPPVARGRPPGNRSGTRAPAQSHPRAWGGYRSCPVHHLRGLC